MSFDVLGDLNWAAVIVAALAYFALGAVWYAPPVFGKTWMASIGWDPQTRPPSMKPMSYIGPLVADVVAAAALGMLALGTSSDTAAEGLILGLVTGVGFAAMLVYVTAVFDPTSPKPMVWAAVTGGYHFSGLLVASIIVSSWT